MIFNFERILSFYLYGIVLFRPDLKYTIRILPRSCKTFKSTVAWLFFKGKAIQSETNQTEWLFYQFTLKGFKSISLTTSESFLKICITKFCKLQHGIISTPEPDIRQRHSIKCIILAGSIYGHVSKQKKISIFRKLPEFIISNHIS